jgi:3-hydroxyisobutyrate dehydrogenase-like beta-hydroxyacid dehydrogenase
MSKPTIGVIGLGLMGGAMAKRLIETGHGVVGYDIVADKLAAAAAFGARASSTGRLC